MLLLAEVSNKARDQLALIAHYRDRVTLLQSNINRQQP